MAPPALDLDACVDHRLLWLLPMHGLDVQNVGDPRIYEISDEAQLLYATARSRVLLSHNQLAFRYLHERFVDAGRPHGGIALVPQTVPLSRLIARIVLVAGWLATFDDVRSRLFRWSDLQRRLGQGYRPPGLRLDEDSLKHALAWE